MSEVVCVAGGVSEVGMEEVGMQEVGMQEAGTLEVGLCFVCVVFPFSWFVHRLFFNIRPGRWRRESLRESAAQRTRMV